MMKARRRFTWVALGTQILEPYIRVERITFFNMCILVEELQLLSTPKHLIKGVEGTSSFGNAHIDLSVNSADSRYSDSFTTATSSPFKFRWIA